jgi:hypothetical protein
VAKSTNVWARYALALVHLDLTIDRGDREFTFLASIRNQLISSSKMVLPTLDHAPTFAVRELTGPAFSGVERTRPATI